MRGNGITALAAVLAVAAPAMADTYYPLMMGKTTILLDMTTLKRSGDIAKAWAILILDPPPHSYDFQIGLDQFNCSTDESSNITSTTYTSSGDVFASARSVQPWEPIVPNTNEALFEAAICNGVPNPKLLFTTDDRTPDIVKKIRAVRTGP
jgi:hypothetical protein